MTELMPNRLENAEWLCEPVLIESYVFVTPRFLLSNSHLVQAHQQSNNMESSTNNRTEGSSGLSYYTSWLSSLFSSPTTPTTTGGDVSTPYVHVSDHFEGKYTSQRNCRRRRDLSVVGGNSSLGLMPGAYPVKQVERSRHRLCRVRRLSAPSHADN